MQAGCLRSSQRPNQLCKIGIQPDESICLKDLKVMPKKLYLIIFVLVCLMSTAAFSQTPMPPLLTFNDLQKYDVNKANFKIAGYVIETYKCPPCPPNAQCKPCLGNHIVITNKADQKNLSMIKLLRIFTDNPKQFELKKKYLFTVKIRGKIETGHAIEDVDLTHFDTLKH